MKRFRLAPILHRRRGYRAGGPCARAVVRPENEKAERDDFKSRRH